MSEPSRVVRAPSPEARAAQLAAEERDHRRRRLRRLLWRVLGCLGSAAAGAGLMGLALHTSDARWGEIAFWGGLLVGYGGIFLTLLISYQQAQEEGDG